MNPAPFLKAAHGEPEKKSQLVLEVISLYVGLESVHQ